MHFSDSVFVYLPVTMIGICSIKFRHFLVQLVFVRFWNILSPRNRSKFMSARVSDSEVLLLDFEVLLLDFEIPPLDFEILLFNPVILFFTLRIHFSMSI